MLLTSIVILNMLFRVKKTPSSHLLRKKKKYGAVSCTFVVKID